MARRFADAILEAVTGIQGPFESKLAFVSTRGGRFKEIYTQTIDGEDLPGHQQSHNQIFPDAGVTTRDQPALSIVQVDGARALHR